MTDVAGRLTQSPVVGLIDPALDPAWSRLAAASSTSVFQSPQWLRVLRDTYGFRMGARVLHDSTGAVSAGVVYTEPDDFLDPRIVSLPFSDFCDPIVGDDGEWRQLTEELFARGCRIDVRCLHSPMPLRDERLALAGQARWHASDLQRDEDDVWQGLHSSARRAIRRADAAGVQIRYGTGEADLRAFFELHLRVRRRKYGLLAQPYRFFERIFEHFLDPGQAVLILALLDGRPVAGCLFLEWRDTLYYKFNASDADHLQARPNDRVLWEGIRYAQARGLRRLDFGLTDWDQTGLIQYKRKYATQERTISLLRHLPPGAPSARDQATRAVLGQLTTLLVDDEVPEQITERAGDLLYRYFT